MSLRLEFAQDLGSFALVLAAEMVPLSRSTRSTRSLHKRASAGSPLAEMGSRLRGTRRAATGLSSRSYMAPLPASTAALIRQPTRTYPLNYPLRYLFRLNALLL